jgi:lipoate-protein ligase A
LTSTNQPSAAYPAGRWRLITSGYGDGPRNMAVDEAILEAVAAGESPPTLRFYAWQPPCVSLGYRQPANVVDVERCAAAGWDVVRRPTGGRAILHVDELTYSVVAPVG